MITFFNPCKGTHNAEQPVKIFALLVSIDSVPQGGVDLMGGGRAPLAALTALALQLGVAAQSHSVEVV